MTAVANIHVMANGCHSPLSAAIWLFLSDVISFMFMLSAAHLLLGAIFY